MNIELYQYNKEKGEWTRPPNTGLDSKNTLLILFGAFRIWAIRQAAVDLCAMFPEAVKIGCSTAGEILGSRATEAGLVLAVVRFERTALRLVTTPVSSPNESEAVGRAIVGRLSAPDLKGILVLSEGLAINGSELARGLLNYIDETVEVAGGLAGDYEYFELTSVLVEREDGSCSIEPKHVAAVGFYGDAVRFKASYRGGFRKKGEAMRITSSSANVLYELDHQPALDVYRRELGRLAEDLPSSGLLRPLSVRRSPKGREVVRTVLAVNDVTKTVTFAGEIPRGGWATFMQADPDDLSAAAWELGDAMREYAPEDGEILAVVVDCAGRRLLMGKDYRDEIGLLQEGLPDNVKTIGFYSYGELSPSGMMPCDLHNQTMTLAMIWEAQA